MLDHDRLAGGTVENISKMQDLTERILDDGKEKTKP